MGNKINDPIVRLMGLRYKSHPWHGLDIGTDTRRLRKSSYVQKSFHKFHLLLV